MATRKGDRRRGPKSNEEQKLQAIYAESRRKFSAADLQKFAVVDKGVPLKKVIAEMEQIQENDRHSKHSAD